MSFPSPHACPSSRESHWTASFSVEYASAPLPPAVSQMYTPRPASRARRALAARLSSCAGRVAGAGIVAIAEAGAGTDSMGARGRPTAAQACRSGAGAAAARGSLSYARLAASAGRARALLGPGSTWATRWFYRSSSPLSSQRFGSEVGGGRDRKCGL